MKKAFKIIISGGGTGGHIFPAIAIANEVKTAYPQAEVLFVGALGKMEMEKIPEAGYAIVGLPMAGLQRSMSLKNLTLPFKIGKSLRLAGKIINDFKPDVIVGVGGYASGPLLWMAARKGIPCIIHESNSYAGLTNRLLAKRAKIVCVAHNNMERFFPKEKIRLTGNPVRNSIVPVTEKLRQEGCRFFGIDPTRICILVVGGSLGARTLNNCVQTYTQQYGAASPAEVIWQCGGYYRQTCEAFVQAHPTTWLHLHPFINRMELAFAVADVVISRSGASTLAELCVAGKAVIFVPSPNVSEDHQTHNAMALVNQQAALMVPEDQAAETLMQTALNLAHQAEQKASLEHNISKLAQPNAVEAIVHEIIHLIKS